MRIETLIDWIAYYIKEAATDKVAARRIARINAHITLKKNLENRFAAGETVTVNKIDTLDITDYMKRKLKKTITLGPAPADDLPNQLAAIRGLGRIKAAALIKAGVKSPADLMREPYVSSLPIEVRTWLKYEPLAKIPRAVITKLSDKLKKILNYKFDIAGSYRREKPFSGDIDLLILHDKIDDVLQDIASLKPVVYTKGPEKASVLIKPTARSPYIKMDIMLTTKRQYYYYLLYLTGSKENNINMRRAAKKKGLLLNQRGLFRGSESCANLIAVSSEKDIYKTLGLKYLHPKSR